MVSDPSTGEIWAVRYRLRKIGDTASALSDAIIIQHWKEIVAEAQADIGKTYDGSDYLWIGCAAWGTAANCLMDIAAGLFDSKHFRLGDLEVTEQGLNWNVGIIELQRYFLKKFDDCSSLLATGKYAIINTGTDSSVLEVTLANIMPEARG